MNIYIFLAKSAVEKYVKERVVMLPPLDLPKRILKEQKGVFITIMKQDRLRACIGTYLPTRPNVAEEIIENAVSAASKDYRFGPIRKEELDYLSYTVSILSFPEPIESIDELDPKRFGLIVKTSPFIFPNKKDNKPAEEILEKNIPFKSGVLLPDLAGINTKEEQFIIACEKAGIDPDKEKVFIYRFRVEKYSS